MDGVSVMLLAMVCVYLDILYLPLPGICSCTAFRYCNHITMQLDFLGKLNKDFFSLSFKWFCCFFPYSLWLLNSLFKIWVLKLSSIVTLETLHMERKQLHRPACYWFRSFSFRKRTITFLWYIWFLNYFRDTLLSHLPLDLYLRWCDQHPSWIHTFSIYWQRTYFLKSQRNPLCLRKP